MISAILTIITVSVIGGIAAVVGSLMCGCGSTEAYNVIIGWAISVSPFISWLLIVKVTDGFKKRKLVGGLVAIVKYPIIAFAIYSMMKSGNISPTFVVIGLSSIIPAVIVGGILWNKQIAQVSPKGRGPRGNTEDADCRTESAALCISLWSLCNSVILFGNDKWICN